MLDDTNQHFVAFVAREGRLFEFDGRKECPIDHGPTSETTLLEDATAVIQTFMDRDPEELRFTMVALSHADAIPDEEAELFGEAAVQPASLSEAAAGAAGAAAGASVPAPAAAGPVTQ